MEAILQDYSVKSKENKRIVERLTRLVHKYKKNSLINYKENLSPPSEASIHGSWGQIRVSRVPVRWRQ
jgi:hypothetical protein